MTNGTWEAVPIEQIPEEYKYNVTLYGHLKGVPEVVTLLTCYKFDDGKWYMWVQVVIYPKR